MNKKNTGSILVFIGSLLIATSADAQVAISGEGVTFPDDTEQTSAVIVPMNCPHGDSIVWDSNAESWVCQTDLSSLNTYAIGDTGPGGGIVFYVTDGGLHGLEAAPAPSGGDPTKHWCSTQFDIVGIVNSPSEYEPDPNSGAHNTALIVAECGTDSAAGITAAYVWPNGQTDGFLPNHQELNLMYENLHNQNPPLGGFAFIYWSSSEWTDLNAYIQSFDNGNQGTGTKTEPWPKVRAVRAF